MSARPDPFTFLPDGIYFDTIHEVDVATTLREARETAGLTLRELAERAHTSHSAIAAYESASKVPSTRTLLRVVDAAGYAIDFQLALRKRGGGEYMLPRGEELRQVLELAEQFPARHDSELMCPVFPRHPRPV